MSEIIKFKRSILKMSVEGARTWRHEEDGDDDECEDDENDQNRDDDALPVALLRVGAHQLLQPETKHMKLCRSESHLDARKRALQKTNLVC